MTDAVEIVKGAREFLSAPSRWKKHGWGDGESKACLEGALGLAACNDAYAMCLDEVPEHLLQAAELVLQHVQTFDNRAETLADFNDEARTTHEDVLTVLDKTLADLGEL